MNREKLVLPVSIMVVSIVLGISYYATQVSKQNSIERQSAFKIEGESKESVFLVEESNRRIANEKKEREECYDSAEERAVSFLKTKNELYGSYAKEVKEELYLEDDFNSYYKDCLSQKGLKK